MQVKENTLYSTLEPVEKYLTKKSVQNLYKAAEEKFGAMYDLTFAEFWACSNNDFSILGNVKNPTVLQVYWKKRFDIFAEEFANTLKGLTLPQSAEEIQASQGLVKVTWDEAILVFLQQWFGLKNYKEAEQITLGEILIAKRAAYNRDKFQRRMAEIQRAKLNKK